MKLTISVQQFRYTFIKARARACVCALYIIWCKKKKNFVYKRRRWALSAALCIVLLSFRTDDISRWHMTAFERNFETLTTYAVSKIIPVSPPPTPHSPFSVRSSRKRPFRTNENRSKRENVYGIADAAAVFFRPCWPPCFRTGCYRPSRGEVESNGQIMSLRSPRAMAHKINLRPKCIVHLSTRTRSRILFFCALDFFVPPKITLNFTEHSSLPNNITYENIGSFWLGGLRF